MMGFLRDAWNEGKGCVDPKRIPPLLKASSFASEVVGDVVGHVTHPRLALRLHLTSLSLGWHQSLGMWKRFGQEEKAPAESVRN